VEYGRRLQLALGDAYQLHELIGQGGFGSVYVAWDVRLRRKVAVKALRHDVFNTVILIERFKREARAVAQLRHPNIIPIYAIGEDEGITYMIMPFIEGVTLKDLIRRDDRPSIEECRRILMDAAGALAAAHEEGIVHRDIKPENIMLEGDTRLVQLMDFGLAKALSDEEVALTDEGTILGTPQYMSPEQVRGERGIDGRSDVYSLGIVGYEVLTGTKPFTGASMQSVLAKHLTEDPVPLASLAPDVPPQFAASIMKALAKNRKDRHRTAEQFREALASVRYGATRGAERQSGSSHLASRLRRWAASVFGR
jgi:serine/threonine-protein kinase